VYLKKYTLSQFFYAAKIDFSLIFEMQDSEKVAVG
jgi:hypothetical protein